MRTIAKLILALSLLISCESDINNESIEFPDNLVLSETVSSGCIKKKTFESSGNGYFTYTFSGNSIEIKHAYIHEHCGADWCFEMQVTNENKIVIREIDKAEFKARCLCYFTIWTNIENISEGISYSIEIWNEDMTELLSSTTIYT